MSKLRVESFTISLDPRASARARRRHRLWRLSILAQADADKPLALRSSLNINGRQLTEVWSYELEANNVLRRNQ